MGRNNLGLKTYFNKINVIYLAFTALIIIIFFIMLLSHSNVKANPPDNVSEIWVENTTFSPNGDMIKDVTLIKVVANESQTLYVNIYNSSMQMVYQGLPLSEGSLGNYTGSWNGTKSFDWSVVSDGVYTILATTSNDGNVSNESTFINGTAIVDTKAPFVTLVDHSHTLISEGNIWETFYINITYNEEMDTKGSPTINFINPALGGTLSFSNGFWDGTTTYRAQYTILDNDEEKVGVDIEVTNAMDLGGNRQNLNITYDAFNVDTKAPSVISVIVSDPLITESDSGNVFNVRITFSEPMDILATPVILFENPSLPSTLISTTNDWISNTEFRQNYTVIDNDEEISAIDVNVTSTQDAVGNVLLYYISMDKFDVDSKAPNVVVTIFQGSIQAGIGEWVNITVITDADVTAVDVDLATAGFAGQVDNQALTPLGGGNWYYQFNVTQGPFDGTNTIKVDAVDDAGNLGNNNTKSANWDEVAPTVVVTIYQQSAQAGIGEWINVTAITDADVTVVDVDLATAGFAGQVDNQVLTPLGGGSWYYQFNVAPGSFDGTNTIKVNAVDDAGNTGNDSTKSATWDEVAPTVDVTITQGSTPAGIDDWINITVITDTDVLIVYVDLATAGFAGQMDGQALIDLGGSNWYYNFTVMGGTFDGSNTINVDAQDDAGNLGNNNTESADWDEVAPTVVVTIYQQSAQVGIGEWINVTVITDTDVIAVEVDLATAGFAGQVDNQALMPLGGGNWYYQFNVAPGPFDGTNTVKLNAVDDGGNIGNDSTQSADWDEVAPTLVVTIYQQSAQAGIGEWINVTAITDADVIAVDVDLATAGFAGQVDNQGLTPLGGGSWYYQFNVAPGPFDGTNTVKVDAVDDAGNIGNDSTKSAIWDEVTSSVIITVSDSLITDPDIPGYLWVYCYFGEVMNNSFTPLITFKPDVIATGTITFFGSFWNSNNDWFNLSYVIADVGEEEIGINVSVNGARDDAGNSIVPTTLINAFDVDTLNPTVTISLSDVLITDADAGSTFYLNCSFSEIMDELVLPTISFDPNVEASSTLSLTLAVWNANHDWYNVTYSIADVSEEQFGVDVSVGGAQDNAGNALNPDPTTYVDAFDVDTLNPTVTIFISDLLITDANAGSTFYLNCSFSENMNDLFLPTISFDANVETSGTLTLPSGAWNANHDWYNVTYLIADVDEDQLLIDVSVGGTQDDAGNAQSPDPTTSVGAFSVDTISPAAVSVTPDDVTITDSDVPGVLSITIEYSELMDNGVNPTLTFSPDVVASGTLAFLSSDWYDLTHYRVNYTLADQDEEQLDVDIDVDGAQDMASNSQTPYTEVDVFDVDTENPIVEITIYQENTPAGIGNWMNITVTTHQDVVNVIGDLSVFSGEGTSQPFDGYGSSWYYNFTVKSGQLDGLGAIDLTLIDDAGNIASDNSQSIDMDEEAPIPTVTITQESTSAGIGEWVNITAIIQGDDATSVNVDLGIFEGQMDNTLMDYITTSSVWYYNFSLTAGPLDNALIIINVHATDDAGNTASDNSQTVNADETAPTAEVTVLQQSPITGIGEWVKITVVTDTDVVLLSADLATAGVTGHIDDQSLMKISDNTWHYNFTISPGYTDASAGVSVNIDIIDDAGNRNPTSGMIYFDEVYPEPLEVKVMTEATGATPTKIGDWINVTVDMDEHEDIISMYVNANGIFSNESIIHHVGNIWYLNTTILEGNTDDFVTFKIVVIDDANNFNDTKYDVINLDSIYPYPSNISVFSNSFPAKANEWINITIDMGAHFDTSSIYIDVPGVFSSDLITEHVGTLWYLNTSVPIGTADGEVNITITIIDDAGNQVERSTSYLVDNQLPSQPSRGIPLWVIFLIGCVAAVVVGLGAVAVTEIGHYTFFFFIYFLYTRIKREYLLDNFTRGRIYGYVEANPGDHFNAIKRALGLKNGSLAYHIRTLEREGYIISKRDRGYTRFYPKSIKLPKRNIRELIPLQRDIVEIVKNNPGISQRGIADQLDISYQLVHYHVKVLQDADYLYLEKDAKQSYCYDVESFHEGSGLE